MSETKHTPAPWHWGDGFERLKRDPRVSGQELNGPKYADIGLWGPKGETIIALRIDHYRIEWDSDNGLDDLTAANRDLIAAAPIGAELANSVNNLAEILKRCEAEPDNVHIRSIFNACLRECFENAREFTTKAQTREK